MNNNHPDVSAGLYSTNDEEILSFNNNGIGLYYEWVNFSSTHDGMSFMEFYDIEIIRDHHFHEGIRKYNMFFAYKRSEKKIAKPY